MRYLLILVLLFGSMGCSKSEEEIQRERIRERVQREKQREHEAAVKVATERLMKKWCESGRKEVSFQLQEALEGDISLEEKEAISTKLDNLKGESCDDLLSYFDLIDWADYPKKFRAVINRQAFIKNLNQKLAERGIVDSEFELWKKKSIRERDWDY